MCVRVCVCVCVYPRNALGRQDAQRRETHKTFDKHRNSSRGSGEIADVTIITSFSLMYQGRGFQLRELRTQFQGMVLLKCHCVVAVCCCSVIVWLQCHCVVAMSLCCCSVIVLLQCRCVVAVSLCCAVASACGTSEVSELEVPSNSKSLLASLIRSKTLKVLILGGLFICYPSKHTAHPLYVCVWGVFTCEYTC